MTQTAQNPMSVWRLRAGVFLLLVFWLPAYLLAPTLAFALGEGNDSDAVFRIMIAIMALQTMIGIVGALMVGKTVVKVVRHTKRRQVPKVMWRLFWHGEQE